MSPRRPGPPSLRRSQLMAVRHIIATTLVQGLVRLSAMASSRHVQQYPATIIQTTYGLATSHHVVRTETDHHDLSQAAASTRGSKQPPATPSVQASSIRLRSLRCQGIDLISEWWRTALPAGPHAMLVIELERLTSDPAGPRPRRDLKSGSGRLPRRPALAFAGTTNRAGREDPRI